MVFFVIVYPVVKIYNIFKKGLQNNETEKRFAFFNTITYFCIE